MISLSRSPSPRRRLDERNMDCNHGGAKARRVLEVVGGRAVADPQRRRMAGTPQGQRSTLDLHVPLHVLRGRRLEHDHAHAGPRRGPGLMRTRSTSLVRSPTSSGHVTSAGELVDMAAGDVSPRNILRQPPAAHEWSCPAQRGVSARPRLFMAALTILSYNRCNCPRRRPGKPECDRMGSTSCPAAPACGTLRCSPWAASSTSQRAPQRARHRQCASAAEPVGNTRRDPPGGRGRRGY